MKKGSNKDKTVQKQKTESKGQARENTKDGLRTEGDSQAKSRNSNKPDIAKPVEKSKQKRSDWKRNKMHRNTIVQNLDLTPNDPKILKKSRGNQEEMETHNLVLEIDTETVP